MDSITDDKTTLEAFKESQARIRSIALIHEKLYQSKNLAEIAFPEYVEDLVANLFHTYGIDRATHRLRLDIQDVHLSVDTAIPCSLIINELVSNSLKHAFKNGKSGEVFITLKPTTDNKYELVVGDNGVGYPKDLDFRKTKSLGMQLVLTLTDQLEGQINLARDNGTIFTILFEELQHRGGGLSQW